MPTWALVLTSAAIGATISAVITIAGQLVGQHLERNARRRELLFSKATELARWKNERTVAEARRSGGFAIVDEIFLVRAFFEDLEHLFASGKLPPSGEEFYEQKVKAVRDGKETR